MLKDRWLLVVIALAAGLRFPRLGVDLPHVFHYDEPTVVNCAVWLVQHGTLNPQFFNYPTGMIYLLAAIFAALLGIGAAAGRFTDWNAAVSWLASGTYPRPEEGGVLYFYPTIGVPTLYLIGRSLSAFAGVAAVILVYRLAKRLELGRGGALLAASMIALSPLAVENSRYATTDMIATLAATLAFAALLRVERGEWREWALFGALAGLAAGFKYNAGNVALLAVALAVWRWRSDPGRLIRGIGVAAAAAIVVFLLTTPYSILDHRAFLHDLGYEFRRISTPRPIGEGDVVLETSAAFNVSRILLWNGGPVGILAFAYGCVVAIRTRRFSRIAALLWAVVTILPMLDWKALHPRYLLLALPPIVLLVASGVEDAAGRLAARLRGRGVDARLAIALLVALVLAPGIYSLGLRASRWYRPDPRIAMTRWIESNVPPGSLIVAEKDGPFPGQDRFSVKVVDFAGRFSLEEYRSQGARYLALSGQEKRIQEKGPNSTLLRNLEELRRRGETVWSSGRYTILRIPGDEWEERADALRAQGDLLGARRVIEERLATGGGALHAMKRLAEICSEMGDAAAARSVYRRALDLHPDDMEILLGAAILAIDTGRWDEALESLQQALSVAPGNPLVNYNMAVARLYRARDSIRRGQIEAARSEWMEARRAAATSVRFAPRDPSMAEIADQVERMGARWGFIEGR